MCAETGRGIVTRPVVSGPAGNSASSSGDWKSAMNPGRSVPEQDIEAAIQDLWDYGRKGNLRERRVGCRFQPNIPQKVAINPLEKGLSSL